MSKTTICEIMVPQKRCRIDGSPPSLTVTEPSGEVKIIAAKQHIRLLGANIQDNFSWRAHLLDGERAVIPALRRKLGALKHIAAQLPRKLRQTLANGLILSKINYLPQVWGGAHNKYIKKMQVILNKTARFVCNANIRTSTKSLMEQCNWLFVSESVEYFTLISVWNFKWHNVPFHLNFKIEAGPHNTFSTPPARIVTSRKSYKWRSLESWNSLPQEIRVFPDLNQQ